MDRPLDLDALWPPYAVTMRAGDLTLTIVRDDDLPELAELALAGIHDPDTMPFSVPWTQVPPQELPANLGRWAWRNRASLTPEEFSLPFVVRRDGELLGLQELASSHFPVTRTGETGSWLGRRFQGLGVGTRMRQAVCAFAFDVLDAVEVTSGAFLDNPASLRVSRKVGYVPDGVVRRQRREGEVARNQRLVLTPEAFVRGEPVEVTGAEGLRSFLGISR